MKPRRFHGSPIYRFNQSTTSDEIQPEVTLKLKDILPSLADAVANDRRWLEDFAEDPVSISRDLYEVLLAYRSFRRSAA